MEKTEIIIIDHNVSHYVTTDGFKAFPVVKDSETGEPYLGEPIWVDNIE